MIAAFDRVKCTVTGTGTGNLTLGTAVNPSFRSPEAVLSSTDLFNYEIHAVDGGGSPTGAWETGLGRCPGAGVFSRLSVYDSSDTGAPINFTAGVKHLSLSATAKQTVRKLAENANIYVRSTADGDSGSGLADNDTDAFLTIAAAISHAIETYDLVTNYVWIFVHGDYSAETVSINNPVCTTENFHLSGYLDDGVIDTWVGGISVSNGSGVYVRRFFTPYVTTDNGSSIYANTIEFISGSPASHVTATRGSSVTLGNYNVSGAPATGFGHLEADSCSTIKAVDYMYLKANVTCDKGWAYSNRGLGHFDFAGITIDLSTFAVTGKRYELNGNSVCWTNGGGASFLPGNAAGTTATGGQYL